MKTALCEKDSHREDLCLECRKKLSENKITELDVQVSRVLGKISKNFPITMVEFHHAIDLNEFILLVCSGKIGSLIGKQGKIASELSRSLGKKTRIIEKTKNEKKTIQDMLGSPRIIGVEKIFHPGSSETKIFINRQDESKLLAKKEKIEEALEKLLNTKTSIEFA